MQISKSYVALAATAFAAILAGCSGGGSQVAPSAGNGVTQSVVRGHAPTIDVMGHPGNRTPIQSELKFSGVGMDGAAPKLFLSNNTTGAIDLYPEDNPTNPTASCAGCGGWGLAVRPGAGSVLAAGTSSGTVNIFALPALTLSATVSLTGGGSAYGLCFDFAGGLWADNWPTGTLNYWKKADLVTGHAPDKTINAAGDANIVYYLACDAESKKENTLYAYGYNSSSDAVNVDGVNKISGAETADFTAGNLGSGTGFPGGLAISAKDDLVVNNQYGTLYEAGVKEPWKGNGSKGCTWGFNPNDITNVAYDNLQKEVWGSNINFGGTTLMTYGESIKASPVATGTCATGESGGPSTGIANDEYLGVAVFPNLGN